MLSSAHLARKPSVWSRRELLAMGLAVGGYAELAAGQTASPPASDVTALLQRQTQQLMDAVAAGDRGPWQRYVSETVVFTTEDGTRKSNADLITELRALPPEIWGRIRVTDFSVVRHEEVAVATYIADEDEGYYGQVIHARYRSTDTWLLANGTWQMIGSQVIALRDDPPAVDLAPTALDAYVGRYALTPAVIYTIRQDGANLRGQRTGRNEEALKVEVPTCCSCPASRDCARSSSAMPRDVSSASSSGERAGTFPGRACPNADQHPIDLQVMANHQSRQLGTNGPILFPLGLGCMGMSDFYGPADENESIATIHAALDAGITLIDTGDYYAAGHNELLIGRALHDRRDQALLSVKFGAMRGPDGNWLGIDTRPAAVKNFAAFSLRRLGVDHIDIYRPGRLDPNVPIEETIGAISDLVKAGYVRAIGLSEVGPDTIRRAHAVHPISDLQIEYSIISRGPETRIFPLLLELGIGVTAYGVLSRGLLSGSKPKSPRDFRTYLPRFAGANFERNAHLVEALQQMAAEKGATASQLAIAWVLAKSSQIVPLIGARKRTQLAESLRALQITLSPAEMERIEAALPPSAIAGTRYDEHQMRVLDSER